MLLIDSSGQSIEQKARVQVSALFYQNQIESQKQKEISVTNMILGSFSNQKDWNGSHSFLFYSSIRIFAINYPV